MRDRFRLLIVAGSLALCVVMIFPAPTVAAEEAPFDAADGVVTELYRLVTFDQGTTPDWDQVRALFIDEAVIVLRTSRTDMKVLSVDGFIEEFVSFIDRAGVVETGFVEKIIRTKPMVFGDIAHILVLYDAEVPGSQRHPQQGVDSFHLIHKDGRWWIASIVNEVPMADRPLPAELLE